MMDRNDSIFSHGVSVAFRQAALDGYHWERHWNGPVVDSFCMSHIGKSCVQQDTMYHTRIKMDFRYHS